MPSSLSGRYSAVKVRKKLYVTEEHDFDGVVNTFLVPSEEDNPALVASVSFPGVMSAATGASEKFSDHIDMWALPAHEVFDCYLRGRELDSAIYESLLG